MTAPDEDDEKDLSPAARARFCAVSRQVKPLEELIRFVAAPDGTVVPDPRRRLPGRGVSVTATAAMVAEAVKRKVFARGLGKAVIVPDDLPGRVEALLEKRALEAFAMANKAGGVVAGATKIENALKAGTVIALLHAREAADDGSAKLDRLARATGGEDRPILVAKAFASDEMSLALGRPHVIHAALIAGPASENCLARCRALLVYRGGADTEAGRPSVRHDDPSEASG